MLKPITINFTENGYIVEQGKNGYAYMNMWVAESEKSLLDIISCIIRKDTQDKKETLK